MRNRTVYNTIHGYQVEIDWVVYPTAWVIDREREMVAKKEWIMTGWNLPGPFSIHRRITRWAYRSIRKHERMQRRFEEMKPLGQR